MNPLTVEQAGEALFTYAIDREDVKWLLARLPESASIDRNIVEYELQILKIIGVGWSIAYFLQNTPHKQKLLALFWSAMQEFSKNLSQTTGLMIGQQIDYFETLKGRLDMYVAALAQNSQAPEPATVIGPAFARNCGHADDLFAFMTGSKMFLSVLANVRAYLSAVAPASA